MPYLERFDNPKGKNLDLFCTRNLLDRSSVEEQVATILAAVNEEGDAALHRYSERFDGVVLSSLAVSSEEFEEARKAVDPTSGSARLGEEQYPAFHEPNGQW